MFQAINNIVGEISTRKLTYVALFIIISCSNMGNFCKHALSFKDDHFAYKPTTVKENINDVFFFASEINYKVSDAPQRLTWQDLTAVTYSAKFSKQYQADFQYPVFGKTVKMLEGREFYISGHVIPLDVNQGLYAISKNPYSSCYFCGKSGPESVVSLKFKNKPSKYKLDKVKTFKGTLKLNDSNPMDFIYIFNDTEELKTASDKFNLGSSISHL